MSVYVSLNMRTIAFAFVSLSCVGCGRRVQFSTTRGLQNSPVSQVSVKGASEPLQALVMLVRQFNCGAAFNPAHLRTRAPLGSIRLRSAVLDRSNACGHRRLVMSETAVQERTPTYVTTPIFYVNDVPHVGHAYTSVAADAVARFGRLEGQPTFFATGTDEHGEKVQQSAEKKGVEPQAFCDEVSMSFQNMREPLGLSNDIFVRTTNAEHKTAVTNMWKRLEDADLIYKGVYEGWYSVSDECFYPESELIEVDGEKRDPNGKPIEWRAKEPSYFFKLSAFQQKLLDYYEANPDFIKPQKALNQIVNFLKSEELRDLSISRTSFSWGISVPGDDEHVVYVWVDALTNYLTVLGWPDSEAKEEGDSLYEKFWPHAVHIVGKDILRFHAVYWPAMLMGANLPLPKMIFSHGWWTREGQKISKSLGNAIDPFEVVETYGTDATRFFFLSAAKFGSDADFSQRSMLRITNGFLANSLGNLFNRATTLSFKNCDKAAPPRPEDDSLTEEDKKLLERARALPEKLQGFYAQLDMWTACKEVEDLIRDANVYIDEMEPWVLVKSDKPRFCTVIWLMLEILRIAAVSFAPVMPESSKKMLLALGVDEALAADPKLDTIADEAFAIDGNALLKPSILFPRIDEEELDKAEAAKAAEKAAAMPKKVMDPAEKEKLVASIKAAGDSIREAKEAGKAKDELKPLIDKLLSLKAEYQEATGEPFDPPKKKGKKR